MQVKLNEGKHLTENDLLELVFTPVMASSNGTKKCIQQAIGIIKTIKPKTIIESDRLEKCQAILYTFASKFLDDKDLADIKEALRMTRLGALLFEDGRIEGEAIGIIKFAKKMQYNDEQIVGYLQEMLEISEEEAKLHLENFKANA